jgi:hypothetical protein
MVLKRNLKNIAISLAIFLSIFSFALSVKASNSADVLSQWDHVWQTAGLGTIDYDTNLNYITIYYMNGFTYTQTEKDATTIGDMIAGIYSRIRYTRTYSTY